MRKELLEFESVSTQTGDGQQKLNGFSFTVFKGEWVVFLGMQAASSHTLADLLAGKVQRYSGNIYMNSTKCTINSVKQAQMRGIFHVNGHSSIASNLSVAENICVIRSDKTFPSPRRKKAQNFFAGEILGEKYAHINPRLLASEISLFDKHCVELVKAATMNVEVIVMQRHDIDYSDTQKREMSVILKEYAQNGISIIEFRNDISKSIEFADRIVVLGDAGIVYVFNRDEFDSEKLYKAMGHTKRIFTSSAQEEEILNVSDISNKSFNNLSFKLHSGEVIGFIERPGRACEGIYNLLRGTERIKSGELVLNGRNVSAFKQSKLVQRGMGYIDSIEHTFNYPKEMLASEVFISLYESVMHPKPFNIKNSHFRFAIKEFVKKYSLTQIDLNLPMRKLSANQKMQVMMYRWLCAGAKCILMYQPLRYADADMSQEVIRFIHEARNCMAGIIMTSPSLQVLTQLCTRVFVIDQNGIICEA